MPRVYFYLYPIYDPFKVAVYSSEYTVLSNNVMSK